MAQNDNKLNLITAVAGGDAPLLAHFIREEMRQAGACKKSILKKVSEIEHFGSSKVASLASALFGMLTIEDQFELANLVIGDMHEELHTDLAEDVEAILEEYLGKAIEHAAAEATVPESSDSTAVREDPADTPKPEKPEKPKTKKSKKRSADKDKDKDADGSPQPQKPQTQKKQKKEAAKAASKSSKGSDSPLSESPTHIEQAAHDPIDAAIKAEMDIVSQDMYAEEAAAKTKDMEPMRQECVAADERTAASAKVQEESRMAVWKHKSPVQQQMDKDMAEAEEKFQDQAKLHKEEQSARKAARSAWIKLNVTGETATERRKLEAAQSSAAKTHSINEGESKKAKAAFDEEEARLDAVGEERIAKDLIEVEATMRQVIVQRVTGVSHSLFKAAPQ